MQELTLNELRPLGAKLTNLCKQTKVGETKQYLTEDELNEINGICEPLYATRIEGGIVVHYDTDGDWTKALLVPESHLDKEDWGDEYSPLDEALEWFFNW